MRAPSHSHAFATPAPATPNASREPRYATAMPAQAVVSHALHSAGAANLKKRRGHLQTRADARGGDNEGWRSIACVLSRQRSDRRGAVCRMRGKMCVMVAPGVGTSATRSVGSARHAQRAAGTRMGRRRRLHAGGARVGVAERRDMLGLMERAKRCTHTSYETRSTPGCR